MEADQFRERIHPAFSLRQDDLCQVLEPFSVEPSPRNTLPSGLLTVEELRAQIDAPEPDLSGILYFDLT